MKKNISMFFKSLFLLGLLNCTSNKKPDKEKLCLIGDTLINSISFNISKNEFKQILEIPENRFLAVNGTKISCKYIPNFYKNKLYAIQVELNQLDSSANTKPRIFDSLNFRNSMFSQLIEEDVLNRKNKFRNKIESEIARKIIEIYIAKYSNPNSLVQTGVKGEWVKEYNSSYIREYGEFKIHKVYVWSCDFKEIKIEFEIMANLSDLIWRSESNENDILSNRSYTELQYHNFNISYTDLNIATQVNQELGKKVMENLRKIDSIEKYNDAKLKESI
jgi:hypothetical protein